LAPRVGDRPPAERLRSTPASLAEALLSPRPLDAREVVLASLLLLVVGGLAFGSHILGGGFIMDDWSNAAKARYAAPCCAPGVTGADVSFAAVADSLLQDGPAGYHLGLSVLVPVAYFFFGAATGPHLILAMVLGVAMSGCFYVLLRRFDVAPLHAGLIAALALIFPFSDATRLWAMAGYNQLAVVLYLAGLLLALGGLRAASRNRAIALHMGALVLYAVGILIYELVGAAVLGSVGFYLLARSSWRGAGVRFITDAAVAGLTLWFVVEHALPRRILPWDQQLAHALRIADDALTLLAYVVVPFGPPSRAVVGAVLLLVILLALARRSTLPKEDRLRAMLGRWLVTAAAASVGIAMGYILIVPAPYRTPLGVGIENRVNMLAALGWVTLMYAIAMLAGLLAAARLRRSPHWAALAPVLVSLIVGTGYLDRLGDSKGDYDRSYTEQLKVLQGVSDARPYRDGATIYTFGHATYIAPGVPIFTWKWDLNSAVKIRLNEPSLAAFAMLPGTHVRCEKRSLYPVNDYGFGPEQSGRYGNAYFVDIASGARQRIASRDACRRARERFNPGPLRRGGNCRLVGGGRPATHLRWACPGEGSQAGSRSSG